MSAGVYIECPDCPFLLWEGRAVTHNCSHSKTVDRLRSGLAKAEAALREIYNAPASIHRNDRQWALAMKDVARRYFAEKGDDRG